MRSFLFKLLGFYGQYVVFSLSWITGWSFFTHRKTFSQSLSNSLNKFVAVEYLLPGVRFLLCLILDLSLRSTWEIKANTSASKHTVISLCRVLLLSCYCIRSFRIVSFKFLFLLRIEVLIFPKSCSSSTCFWQRCFSDFPTPKQSEKLSIYGSAFLAIL